MLQLALHITPQKEVMACKVLSSRLTGHPRPGAPRRLLAPLATPSLLHIVCIRATSRSKQSNSCHRAAPAAKDCQDRCDSGARGTLLLGQDLLHACLKSGSGLAGHIMPCSGNLKLFLPHRSAVEQVGAARMDCICSLVPVGVRRHRGWQPMHRHAHEGIQQPAHHRQATRQPAYFWQAPGYLKGVHTTAERNGFSM